MKYYIAVDLGATSGRVVLAGVDSNDKVSMETLHRFPTPLLEKPEGFFWDFPAVFENILEGLAIAGSRGVEITSIGVDCWGVDFVGVDASGAICGLPHSYRDPYSFAAQDEFFTKMSRRELYERTGIQIMNFNSVFQLYAQSKKGELAGAEKILFLPDAISYLLTGKMVCEYTILSTSAIMNPRDKSLDAKILDICGVSADKFAPLVYPGAVVGTLKEDIAARTGLGAIPVKAVAGHDTGSVVAAVPASGKNFAYLSSGTWSLMGIETDSPVITDETYESNFTNEGGVGGTIRLLKNITGMWLLEQCLAKWRSEGRTYAYDEVHAMAGALPKCEQVLDPDDRSFASPQDMPAAIAQWCSSHGLPVPENDAQTVRLIYDSLAARYAAVLSTLKRLAPYEIDTLHIVGGGSQNKLLNTLTAQACNIKVVAGPAEGTALGNVMVQSGLSRSQILKSIKTEIYKPL